MAFSGPSVTFCFGSDSRVTLPESLLSSLPAGGNTFGSFTDSAYVTLGGPTPSEAAAFSPPQRRGRAAMHPFGRPVARQPARAVVRPLPVRAQPVCPVARQPAPRPLPVQPVHPVVRRPSPIVPVVRPAPAPQRRQPVVPLAVVPVEATRARVSPPPSSSRKRGSQAELPSPSSRLVSIFARLSHPETARQTPVTPVVAPVPPVVQSVGPDVASSSTSGLGRRARRNRNRRLRLATSEEAVQEMVVSVAQQEPAQWQVVPSQREPCRPTVVHTPDVVVAPEIDAVQGGRFSPLVHSGDEEDAGRIRQPLLLPLLSLVLESPGTVPPGPSHRGSGASSVQHAVGAVLVRRDYSVRSLRFIFSFSDSLLDRVTSGAEGSHLVSRLGRS
ncbi:hypothetical protein M5K25_021849 [Dendrobium thyrsiflorum]|uniref:Uncharacterized protein n=1 Tax=Dendrobium thyrsiflorum TaxID=117978 RepID=A0ABD0UAX6_DENTH